MTRLCGYISAGEATIAAGLRMMIQAMDHGVAAQAGYATLAGGGLGLLGHPQAEPALAHEGDTCLALAGYILPDSLPPAPRAAHLSLPARLLHAWRIYGDELLPRLDGDFALAHYDAASATLTLASSALGTVPLYLASTPHGLAFASEAKALLRLLGRVELDWEGAADFFYVGHLLGSRTLFAGIEALGAGEVLCYQAGRVRRRRYLDLSATPVRAAAEVSTARLAELFEAAVVRRAEGVSQSTLLLSGGMDSRLLLGALRRAGVTPSVMTLENANIRNGTDGRYAQAIAEQLGVACELRRTRPGFYASPDCLHVFYILDGMSPAWNWWIGQIYPELAPGAGVIWDGLGLDVALGGAHQHRSLAANLAELLEPRSVNRGWLKRILAPEAFAALDEGFMERLHSALAAIPPTQNQYLHFLLQQRTRRKIAPNPYQLYATKVAPRTPGTDRAFLSYVLSIPCALTRDHRLYVELYRRHFPELTAVPIISGGSLLYFENMYATTAREYIEALRLGLVRASRGFNLKRRVRRLLGRPATSKDQERSGVIVETLGSAAFDRPCYNTAELRRLFAEYRDGNFLYHDLFMSVFYIELWHKLFLQPDAEALPVVAHAGTEAAPLQPAFHST